MNDLASAPTMADSTALDPGASGPSAAGGGAPSKLPEAAPSLQDSIAAAIKEVTPKEDTDAAKPDATTDATKGETEKGAQKAKEADKAPDAKEAAKGPERAPDGKFAGKEKAPEGDAAKDAVNVITADPKGEMEANGFAKSNGSGQPHINPPAKFLPDAKETWRNTPRAVQRDIDNAVREHEAEVTRYRESAERYEPIRRFDEAARQAGRAGVHESLAEVAQLENLMGQNPLAALNQILQRAGPRKPDGSPVSLFEVAQTIVQMGQQGYNQAVSRQPQQPAANNNDPRIQQLEQQIATMAQQQVALSVIEPFKASHPRYEELQGDIALFLKSDKIARSLSPSDRLAAAYDMAERINPPSNVSTAAETDPDPARRAGDDFSGSTSIKSTPGAVTPNDEPDRGGSIEEVLRAAVKRQSLGR
jgi:hypothetical protein